MRNIGTYGQLPGLLYPIMADFTVKDGGKLNLTKLIAKDTSYYLYTNFDRAYIEYISGSFELSIGRQRINWGINMLWTPNDIFNSNFRISAVENDTCSLQLVFGKICFFVFRKGSCKKEQAVERCPQFMGHIG